MEYTVILVAAVLLAATAFVVGRSASEVFPLVGSILGDERPRHVSVHAPPVDGEFAPRPTDANTTSVADRTMRSYALPLLLIALVLLLALRLLRQRRRLENLGWVTEETEPTQPEATQQRLFNKRQDLLRLLSKRPELMSENELKVSHLMTREVVAVTPETTFDEMTSRMKEKHMRHLLVCDQQGHLLGMVSHRDLCRPRGTKAKHFMSRRLLTVSPDSPLSSAITQLVSAQVSCLPVLEDDVLRGVITTTDVALALQCFMQLRTPAEQVVEEVPC